MNTVKPLPDYLMHRFNSWRSNSYESRSSWYARLAELGQQPRAMVISCCDSRVQPMAMFGAEPGEFFMVQNVANLVPPYAPDHDHHGTSAAIEYAVNHLKVAHIIVMGHSSCGGVQACHDMCSGNAPELEDDMSFIGRWMDILRPGYDAIKDTSEDRTTRLRALEKQGVLMSLSNLMSFPYVKAAVDEKKISTHGLWYDIGTGTVEQYDPKKQAFAAI